MEVLAPISNPEWKVVPGYSKYTINKKGQVKSHGKLIREFYSNGYAKVCLSNKGVSKQFRVHRLVAMTWLPKPTADKTQINHIDGNKLNNSLENLEWCSPSENMLHFRQLHPQGLAKVKLRFTKDGEATLTFNSIKEASVHFKKALSTLWGASLSGRFHGYKVERITEQLGITSPSLDAVQPLGSDIQSPASAAESGQTVQTTAGNEVPTGHYHTPYSSPVIYLDTDDTAAQEQPLQE